MVQTEPSGILVLNKPVGITSHDAVYKIRRLFATKKVGHTGTLDPLASGVLIMLVGSAAKAAEYLSSDSKRYVALLKLGITTDTQDITGKVLSQSDGIPCAQKVESAAAQFLGETDQVPPMYSALKVGGKKLYDLAREGKTVEREARRINVSEISVTPTQDPTEYLLSVTCSAGTYIRTLCDDIGRMLGCGATMASLERDRAGEFDIRQAVTLEQLEQESQEQRYSRLITTEQLFSSLDKVILSEFYYRLATNGCEIYQKKIRTSFGDGERVRVYSPENRFFALGEVREYPDGSAIKLLKRF